MARSNGNKTRSAGPGDTPSGDAASGGDSGSATSTSAGGDNGRSRDGGDIGGEGGADGDNAQLGQVHSGGRAIDSESVGESTGSSGAGADRGSDSDTGRAKRKRRTRAEIQAALAGGDSSLVGEIRAPADLSHAKLGRKRRSGNKANTTLAVGFALDLGFSARKYMLGPGYEFWELDDAEKKDLAEKAVACLDALPQGKSNKVIKFLLDQVEMITPFVALAMAGYSTVSWRMEMTRQLKAATPNGAARVARNHGEAGGNTSSVGGDAHAGANGVQAPIDNGNSSSSNGSGSVVKPNGNVASLFAPPPHIGA